MVAGARERQEPSTDHPELEVLPEWPLETIAVLVTTDPALRQRMVELGYRALSSSPETAAPLTLDSYLQSQNLPVPSSENDYTRALLPDLDLFEEMIKITGGCPS